MPRVRDYGSLLRGQHFYSAVRVVFGVMLCAGMGYIFGDMRIAAIMTSGALCLSSADSPTPKRHKLREIAVAWAASSLLFLIVSLIQSSLVGLGIFMALAGFFISFMAIYGNRIFSIGFAVTFTIMVALGAPNSQNFSLPVYFTWFLAGSTLYGIYAVISNPFFIRRVKQQCFAECSIELAKFLRARARLYETGATMKDIYPVLVAQQSSVVEKHQAAREFIFRDIYSDEDRRIAKLFIMQVDFFEALMASNNDYDQLHEHFSGSDIMLFMRDLMFKIGKNFDGLARTALTGKPPEHSINYKAEIFAIEYDLERLSHDASQDANALTELVEIFEKIIACTERIQQLEKVQLSPYEHDKRVAIKLSAFTTGSNFSLRLFKDNFTLASPHFRHALRVAVAMEVGYCMSLLLHYFSGGVTIHYYWIFLTISVVMRSNFSVTVQRQNDRIIGTIIGCLIGAFIFFTDAPPSMIIALLFLAQLISNTFVAIEYKTTSAAASIVCLLQIHLLNPSTSFVFWERILDTFIGGVIAYGASFVFPSWESRRIPELVKKMAQANSHYTRAVLTFGTNEETFRLARKKMMDSMAELTTAFNRMLREPINKRSAVAETSRYISLNYLFSSRIAAIGLLLGRLEAYPSSKDVIAPVEQARDKLEQLFRAAGSILDGVPVSIRHVDDKTATLSEAVAKNAASEAQKKKESQPTGEYDVPPVCGVHSAHPKAGSVADSVAASVATVTMEKAYPLSVASTLTPPQSSPQAAGQSDDTCVSRDHMIVAVPQKAEAPLVLLDEEGMTEVDTSPVYNPFADIDEITGQGLEQSVLAGLEDRQDAHAEAAEHTKAAPDSKEQSASAGPAESKDKKNRASQSFHARGNAEQHIMTLLNRQLDAALNLVIAIEEVEVQFVKAWSKDHVNYQS